MKRGYFWKPADGLKHDIERHRATEKELRGKIEELEAEVLTNPDQKVVLNTYYNILRQLLDSKAEVVSRIGK